jgi:hypothetical protein
LTGTLHLTPGHPVLEAVEVAVLGQALVQRLAVGDEDGGAGLEGLALEKAPREEALEEDGGEGNGALELSTLELSQVTASQEQVQGRLGWLHAWFGI